jgi:RNA polymerase sigma-70 factor (ECF subfamily)
MDQDISDEELMMMYRNDDAAAFAILYSRHKGGMYRYVRRQCSDHSITDELFQDIWMKLIQSRQQYQVKAKFTTWLYTIARHHLIDHYRKSGNDWTDANADELDSIAVRPQDQPENIVAIQQDTTRLLTEIEALPPLQREAILLKEEAGLSLQEIATLTGANLETVKSRLRYAIRKLHQVMNYDQ